MSWIQMRDFWTFRPTEVLDNKRHLFECKDSKSDSGHSLLVHVAATHAGIVNGNMRFYRPDKMQDGIHTWLPKNSYQRPVLIGHDEKGDVLGRVLEARYVDESWKYAGDFPVVKDFLFYNRDGRKRQSLFDSVDWIVDNLMDLEDYTGLGYTDLGLRITNPEAIRKVLADEYLTVSVGFKTDSAVCSLCHTDWAVDGKCEHKLGQHEDGKTMFLISGQFVNQEVSFINFPADPFATTISKETLTDSLKNAFFLGLPLSKQQAAADGMRMTDGLVYELDLAATEEPMQTAIDITKLDLSKVSDEIKSPELTKERAAELKVGFVDWHPETDELKTQKRSLTSTLNAKIRKNGWDKVQASVDATDAEVAAELTNFLEDGKKKRSKPGPSGQSKGVSKEEEEKTKKFQNEEEDGKKCPDCGEPTAECTCDSKEEDCECAWDGWEPETDEDREFFADVDGIDAELEVELLAAIKDGELPAETQTDAKLSSEARNKLPKKSFCGPNRSFPVADCAHVTAAKRLLNRAKVSDGTKAKIRSCVDSKAKTLKCSVSSKKEDGIVDEIKTQASEVTTDEQKFIDHADKIISVVQTDAQQAEEVTAEERTALHAIVVALDKAYDKFAKTHVKYTLRWAVRALLTDWDADDEVRWALNALKGTDHVVFTSAEIAEKDEALNGLMSEKDALTGQVAALQSSRAAVLAASKRTLAQQIVMNGVLTGQDLYKDLTQDQITERIGDLAKRHITSLNDSVQDILAGLKWTDGSPKPTTESKGQLDDNIRVTDEAAVSNTTDSRQQDEAAIEHQKLLTRLRYMTVTEQNRYLTGLRFEAAKASTS